MIEKCWISSLHSGQDVLHSWSSEGKREVKMDKHMRKRVKKNVKVNPDRS